MVFCLYMFTTYTVLQQQMTRDMAMLEIGLSSLTQINTLGSSYQELRAYRQLLFLDITTTSQQQQQQQQQQPALLAQQCIQQLRPSTVLHYLLSRCPLELSSPHVFIRSSKNCKKLNINLQTAAAASSTYANSGRDGSVGAFCDWLLRGYAAADWRTKHADTTATGYTTTTNSTSSNSNSNSGVFALYTDVSYEAECSAWSVVQGCIDEYHQRLSASVSSASGSSSGADDTVQLVEVCGAPLLSADKLKAK
jgi:hypothetical protein